MRFLATACALKYFHDADGVMNAGIGIAMIERDALGAGAVPEVLTESDAPGRGWAYRSARQVEDAATDTTTLQPWGRFVADLRGMRKIQYAQPTLLMQNQLHTGTAFTIRFFGFIRCLYKLP